MAHKYLWKIRGKFVTIRVKKKTEEAAAGTGPDPAPSQKTPEIVWPFQPFVLSLHRRIVLTLKKLKWIQQH